MRFYFKKESLLFCVIITLTVSVFAQVGTISYTDDFSNKVDNKVYKKGSSVHSSIKPYRMDQFDSISNFDSLFYQEYDQKWTHYKGVENIINSDLFRVKNKRLELIINPAFNFQLGNDLITDTTTYYNTRGFSVVGTFDKKFSFRTTFYESQAKFSDYLTRYINKTGVMPGQNVPKNFKSGGFDYPFAEGSIYYRPSDFFHIEFGQGKNFIGDGYRSMLLSDNAFNYPYVKIRTTFWKFEYMNLYTKMLELKPNLTTEAKFWEKFTSMHYLNFKANDWLSIGAFEAVVYGDTLQTRNLEMGYLNPIIFYRPIEGSLDGSPDNILIGLNIKLTPFRKHVFYGQVVLDEFKVGEIRANNGWWANKYGFQGGYRTFDLFGIENLSVLLEYNVARPYTYQHRQSLQNYGHFSEPLAHPLGANFKEGIVKIDYNYKRFQINTKVIFAKYGVDTIGGNIGQDIYKSYYSRPFDFGHEIGQGVNTQVWYFDFRLRYIINPKSGLSLSAGMQFRDEEEGINIGVTRHYFVGIRSSIPRFYDDK